MQPSRHTIRLKGYDYSQNGLYFVTICTQNRENLFGDIVDGKMKLNDAGEMIKIWWDKIPGKYTNVKLDIYQIMPNHIHTIIVVGAHPCVRPLSNPYVRSLHEGSTHGSTPTLGNVIQWFKTMTTNKYIRGIKINNWPPFNKRLFQRNYYEHIIRNEEEYLKIKEYIRQNPSLWSRDRNNLMKI
ncbi:hypothetical protein HZC27_00490 [Candidatus Roizmanbacteria bacterium]|nr:hypothetical protein [Candidatus Roizmanbacteria bacterium]